MAKIEQIKAELNRRIELYGNPLGVADVRLQDERKGMLKALSDMLAFIDSLPAEAANPEVDLEKEIRNYDSYLDESGLTVTLDAIARRFAEWGAEHLRDTTKMITEGLDEAAERMASDIAPDYPDISWDNCYEKIKEGIKAGAEWMAGQGAVCEMEVVEDAGGYPIIQAIELYDYNSDEPIYNRGDKVIVQVRKK